MKGSEGPLKPEVRVLVGFLWIRGGRWGRHSLTLPAFPTTAARGDGDGVRPGAQQHLLHANLARESVPWAGLGWGVGRLQGWASPAASWGYQWLEPTVGLGEETGCPGLPPRLTQQDLAQVRLLPWPWLKSLQKDRRSGTFSRTFYRRSSERKRKGRADSASASSVV